MRQWVQKFYPTGPPFWGVANNSGRPRKKTFFSSSNRGGRQHNTRIPTHVKEEERGEERIGGGPFLTLEADPPPPLASFGLCQSKQGMRKKKCGKRLWSHARGLPKCACKESTWFSNLRGNRPFVCKNSPWKLFESLFSFLKKTKVGTRLPTYFSSFFHGKSLEIIQKDIWHTHSGPPKSDFFLYLGVPRLFKEKEGGGENDLLLGLFSFIFRIWEGRRRGCLNKEGGRKARVSWKKSRSLVTSQKWNIVVSYVIFFFCFPGKLSQSEDILRNSEEERRKCKNPVKSAFEKKSKSCFAMPRFPLQIFFMQSNEMYKMLTFTFFFLGKVRIYGERGLRTTANFAHRFSRKWK